MNDFKTLSTHDDIYLQNYHENEIKKLNSTEKSSEDDRPIGRNLANILDLPTLINFAINEPNLSPENWALWCNRVAEINEKSYGRLSYADRKNILQILEKIRKYNPYLPPGQNAQITCSLGKLAMGDESTVKWLFDNAQKSIENYSIAESYLLLSGANKIFSKEQIRKLITNYNYKHQGSDFLEQKLLPHGITCFLKACNKSRQRSTLSDQLFVLAQTKFEQFKLKELIDLIPGLFLYNDNEQGLALLNEIEKKLFNEYDSLLLKDPGSLVVAFRSFASCKFIPKRLMHLITEVLSREEVSLKHKTSIYHSAALLGLETKEDMSFTKLMSDFIFNLNTEKYKQRLFNELDISELVKFFYATAVLLPMQYSDPFIDTLAQFLITKHDEVPQKYYDRLTAAFSFWNYFKEAVKISEKINCVSKSLNKNQSSILETLKGLKREYPTLFPLEVRINGDVKGRKVDILITGFKDLGIKQKPMAINICNQSNFASNDHQHELDRTILLRKHIVKRGIEFASFDLRDGLSNVNDKIQRFIINKYKGANWEKQASDYASQVYR